MVNDSRPLFSGKTVCFFSTVPRDKLQFENYSIQDLRILEELGFEVIIANRFKSIPWNCDLYFSWWASGSILPLIKALLLHKPIITIAGGNEAMLYRDSVKQTPAGYLNYPYWKKMLTRFTLMFSTRVLVVSRFMRSDVMKLGAKDPLVVHNCVDHRLYNMEPEPGSAISSIFKLDKNTVLLKRGEVFLKAIELVIKDFPMQQFIVIGKKGDDYSRIIQLVNELGIQDNIQFLGEINNTEVSKLIQQSALYVQISDTETFGLAVAEAMSCGTPVLVSKRGAIPEVVGDRGIYVDHNDAKSVAEGIKNFLSMDVGKVAEMRRYLRARIVEEFSYEKRKTQLTEIIKSVLIDG